MELIEKRKAEDNNELISRADALQALVDTADIRGYAYTELERRLNEIPTRAVVRDCYGCMGASFGDCDSCESVKEEVWE